jgi:hypothetical protein
LASDDPSMRPVLACLLLAAASSAQAGTIIQTHPFHYAPHGSMVPGFNQLDSSLAPLNAVEFDVTATGSQSFSVMNETSGPLTVTLSGDMIFSTDAGTTLSHFATPLALNPFQAVSVTESLPFSNSLQLLGSPSLTAQYVGTGQFFPGGMFQTASLGVDSSSANVTPDSSGPVIDGTETVKFFFGPTFPAPEPPGLVMLALGLLAVAGVRYCDWSSRLRCSRCSGFSRPASEYQMPHQAQDLPSEDSLLHLLHSGRSTGEAAFTNSSGRTV